jgi:hypothetical protein
MEEERIIAWVLSLAVALIEASLVFAIFRKAGFNWSWSLMALAPLIGLALQSYLIFFGIATPTEGVTLTIPLLLLPLFILAFHRWPLAVAGTASET